MITEQDLDEAIAKCQNDSNPTNNTCIRLAAFLTLKDYMYGDIGARYSEASGETAVVHTSGKTEFLSVIDGMSVDSVVSLFGELMDALLVVNLKLYDSVLNKAQA